MIEISELTFPEVKKIKRKIFTDERGFFVESYRQNLYQEKGIAPVFIQDNYSYSREKTIRGMHFQTYPGQAKLISVIVGSIYDVFVDIRPESPNFGKWGAYELHAQNQEQIFIPEGFAHGFAALTDVHVLYKVSSLFSMETEKTFYYNDPQVGIKWPFTDPILSDKDRKAPSLEELLAQIKGVCT